MAFFPKDYEPQQGTSGYYRLKAGKNQFRAIGPALVGFEAWASDGDKRKPVRRRMDADGAPTPPYKPGDYDADGKVKQIVIFPVIDRLDGQVKIAQFHQASILGSIQSLAESDDWRDPHDRTSGYDIIVNRKGEGLDTEYSVVPGKAKPLTPDELAAIAAKPLNLDVLFDNGDPFAHTNGQAAPANTACPLPASLTSTTFTVASVAQSAKNPLMMVVTSTDNVRYGMAIVDGPDFAERLTTLKESVNAKVPIVAQCRDSKAGSIIEAVGFPEAGADDSDIPF